MKGERSRAFLCSLQRYVEWVPREILERLVNLWVINRHIQECGKRRMEGPRAWFGTWETFARAAM